MTHNNGLPHVRVCVRACVHACMYNLRRPMCAFVDYVQVFVREYGTVCARLRV